MFFAQKLKLFNFLNNLCYFSQFIHFFFNWVSTLHYQGFPTNDCHTAFWRAAVGFYLSFLFALEYIQNCFCEEILSSARLPWTHFCQKLNVSLQAYPYPVPSFHRRILHTTQFSWLLVYDSVCKWKCKITVFLVLVRHHNFKFTTARYLSDTWLGEIIFMEEGLEEMQSSILPYNLKSISGLRGTIRKLPSWTQIWTQHNCHSQLCLVLLLKYYLYKGSPGNILSCCILAFLHNNWLYFLLSVAKTKLHIKFVFYLIECLIFKEYSCPVTTFLVFRLYF